MNLFARTAVVALAGLAAALPGSAASAASGTITTKASVLKPLQLTVGANVDFGTIVTPSAASFTGTFMIDAAASQTSTFCASGFACTGAPVAAKFNLQGTSNNNITVNIPTTVTLTLQGATGTPPTLTFATRNSISATNSGTGNYTIQLPNSGFPGRDFYVGGSVTITETTAGGNYQGSFTVTADYQ